MSDLIVLVIDYVARTAVLTLILWIMVKLQKLDYFFPGLLGSAALAAGLDTIPCFGHYIAVPVLYLCVWKVTHASLMPDAVFTVAVSYALMFAVKILLLTELMGDLRPALAVEERIATNELQTAVFDAKPGPRPAAGATAKNSAANAVARPGKADEIVKDVVVKSATQNGDKSMLTISANKKNFTLAMGDTVEVPMPDSSFRIRLIRVTESWATVEVNGEATYLRIH